jgi:hypothetical protein
MAWEDLEQDIADEFSDNRRFVWSDTDGDRRYVESGFLVFRRSTRPPPRSAHQQTDAAYQRRKRARRRELWIAVGRLSIRCERPGCRNLLEPMKRGAPQRFCSSKCKDWKPPKRKVVRRCSECPTTFETHGRRTTCSNACRQRAWYYRRAGTTGASAGGGATGAQE